MANLPKTPPAAAIAHMMAHMSRLRPAQSPVLPLPGQRAGFRPAMTRRARLAIKGFANTNGWQVSVAQFGPRALVVRVVAAVGDRVASAPGFDNPLFFVERESPHKPAAIIGRPDATMSLDEAREVARAHGLELHVPPEGHPLTSVFSGRRCLVFVRPGTHNHPA